MPPRALVPVAHRNPPRAPSLAGGQASPLWAGVRLARQRGPTATGSDSASGPVDSKTLPGRGEAGPLVWWQKRDTTEPPPFARESRMYIYILIIIDRLKTEVGCDRLQVGDDEDHVDSHTHLPAASVSRVALIAADTRSPSSSPPRLPRSGQAPRTALTPAAIRAGGIVTGLF